MRFARRIAIAWLAVTLVAGRPAMADPAGDSIELVVIAGRPLRVALDRRVTLKRVGQPITGTLVEPVYAYDRIVIAAGVSVLGHVEALESAPKATRVRAMLGGDFSPLRRAVLKFDVVASSDGRQIPINTRVGNGIESVRRQVAGGAEAAGRRETAGGTEAPEGTGTVGRAEHEVKEQARDSIAAVKERALDAISTVKEPGKMERLKDMAINRLPYHPQILRMGTVYDAELVSPLSFGRVPPAELAAAGTKPAPESVLNARLATTLDSAKTPRGTPLEAVVTQPVFSSDHHLILPEGTTLQGEVTFAKRARHWHRNGQLRFLFERVQPPGQDGTTQLASLHSVDVSQADRVAVDNEGGASVANSKTRFIAPALAILALHASADHHFDHDNDADNVGGATPLRSGNGGAQGLGGFFGFGLAGVALSQISQPVGVAFAAVGAIRTTVTNVLGKGKEVSFPADTPIQVRLAPGPTADK